VRISVDIRCDLQWLYEERGREPATSGV